MADEMKNGLIKENGVTIYYKNGVPTHAGVIKVDGDIYYAGEGGKLAVGKKIVHRSMANGFLKHGTYKFDEDGKLVEDYYHAPIANKSDKSHKRKRKLKSKYKKILKIAVPIFAVVLVAAVVCFGWLYKPVAQESANSSASDIKKSLIELPDLDGEVYLCSKVLESYYEGDYSLSRAISASSDNAYAPFVFSYKLSEGATAELELDGKKYDLDPNSTFIKIDNLLADREYLYTVTAKKGDNTETYNRSFKTADTNRFIYLPGVKNTRDIGGYKTDNGSRIRQGVLVRGSEIDGAVEGDFFLTDTSVAEELGFEYDFDLRQDYLYSSGYVERLGKNVRHKYYSSPSYGSIFSDVYRPFIKEIFTDLANEENYPMYMHCTYGADRTGTIVFLLQGLLGVSEEDMEREYLLSKIAIRGSVNIEKLNGIYGGLEGKKGDTIKEKIENYLIDDIGITKDQINKIREIFLED